MNDCRRQAFTSLTTSEQDESIISITIPDMKVADDTASGGTVTLLEMTGPLSQVSALPRVCPLVAHALSRL